MEHPRARGENGQCCVSSMTPRGTSPRTRGKPWYKHVTQFIDRNIPAHAGKTGAQDRRHSHHSEHPRARGENDGQMLRTWLPDGTSPRTRGKHWGDDAESITERNIPAHAGKTMGCFQCFCPTQEHPRARGENTPWGCSGSTVSGTSPRTRGKPRLLRRLVPPGRNIPAHAGKTFTARYRLVAETEHPRARGENPRITFGRLNACGTSPRTRGKLGEFHQGFPFCRNIPAHAGKTQTSTHETPWP